jgi:hypothetical protein
MTTITSDTLSSDTLPSPADRDDGRSGAFAEFKGYWRQFYDRAFDPYRPELHYMRGPGPAWRAKQVASSRPHST